jgi:hypothetical protein
VLDRLEGDYVEGVAVCDLGFILAHAWVTLDGVHAVDQTWPQPGLGYFGILIPQEEVAKLLLERGYIGAVFDEYPESWMELTGAVPQCTNNSFSVS